MAESKARSPSASWSQNADTRTKPDNPFGRSRYLLGRAPLSLFLLVSSVLVGMTAAAQVNTPPWSFVSSPDMFNADIADFSGSTPGVPEAPGWKLGVSKGLNGVSPRMEGIYRQVVGEIAAHQPDLFLVAGDLINGRWFEDATLDMFDPTDRNRTTAIDNAADIYYGWYRWLFKSQGIDTILGAIGDHEIGDDDWPTASEKSEHIGTMKRAFRRNMVDVLALPETVNGVPSRPLGTVHQNGSYAHRHKNVLFVTIDVFSQPDASTTAHPWYGTVTADLTDAHLEWLEAVLTAADSDPTLDHVIVQGHTPVLPPVRMHRTSGSMMATREDSGFWQVLRRHDLRSGGKVRLYLSGEVHAVTATLDPESDIVQVVHGDPPRGGANGNPSGGNYAVFTVRPDGIEAVLWRFDLEEDGNSLYWQSDDARTSGPSSVSPSIRKGGLRIDLSGKTVRYASAGDLRFVDPTSMVIHFGFDDTTASGAFSNLGTIGDGLYEGVANGDVLTTPGKFGAAARFDGLNDFVESGRGNITEGESRTVSAWIRTRSSGRQTVLSYGADKRGTNGRFNFGLLNGRLQVNISKTNSCKAASNTRVNDGAWHHIAVVLTDEHDNRCADMLFYIDGTEFPATTDNATARLHTLPWRNFRIGVDHTGDDGYFSGEMDDIAVWAIPLSGPKMLALANVGKDPTLRFDATIMQSLFDVYDDRDLNTPVDGLNWSYANHLGLSGGEVAGDSSRPALQLDEQGNGVTGRSPVTSYTYGATGLLPFSGDWDGDGRDATGVYDPITSRIFLSNVDGSTLLEFITNRPGHLPIAGDWNGDGIDTVGLFNSNTATFSLRDQNTSASTETVFRHGLAGFLPIAGDWDGDGIDTVGLYNSETGRFFLRNGTGEGPTDLSFVVQQPGLVPIAGDWNRDGVDSIGVYNPKSSTYALRNDNSTGTPSYFFRFGQREWIPLAGDWNGDGRATTGVFNPASARIFIRNDHPAPPPPQSR